MTKDEETSTTRAAAQATATESGECRTEMMAGGKICCIVADKGEKGPKESTMNGCLSNNHHNQQQQKQLHQQDMVTVASPETEGNQSVAGEQREIETVSPQLTASSDSNELNEKISSSNQTSEQTKQQRSAIRKQQVNTNATNNNNNNNSNNYYNSTHTTATSSSSAISDQQQQQQQVPISADYLAQLIKDKKQLSAFPPVFIHLQRLIDEEINKVRQSLFQLNDVVNQNEPLQLPEPEGEFVQLQEKIYVPVDEHPEYNFVGRLLGPRGMTAKQLEQETGCKIMIRGRGSMRDKKKEEQNRGKANWEHLNDELHVLITVEDTQNRAQIKLKRALEEVKQLLIPIVDGEDELKKRQLMELAIINGTYRDCNYNEALTKMLNEAVYRQTLADGAPNQPGAQHHHQQQQLVVANLANGSPRHFGHMYTVNGSSVSSGVPSTGSNTPNSVHGQHQSGQQQQQQRDKQISAAAAAAAAAHHQHQQSVAAAAVQQHQHNQHQQHQTSAAAVAVAAAAAAAAQHNQHQQHQHHLHQASQSPIPLGPHPAQHLHPHPAQAPAVAAAAALMGASPADPSVLIYAQQYHDFHHYAAMAAAAAASQPLLAPADFAHHHHHHPLNHAAAAQAVAQAVAAAAANQQLQHQHQQQQHQHQHHYQQQMESDRQQHQLAAAAYQQQQQQQQETSNSKTETDNGNVSHNQQQPDDRGDQQQQ